MQKLQTITDEKEEFISLNTVAVCGEVKLEHNHSKLDTVVTLTFTDLER